MDGKVTGWWRPVGDQPRITEGVRSERQKHEGRGSHPPGSERSDDRLGFRSVDAFWINRSDIRIRNWYIMVVDRRRRTVSSAVHPVATPSSAAEPRGSGGFVEEGGRMVRLHILFRHDCSLFASFIALSRPRKTFLYRLPKCLPIGEWGEGKVDWSDHCIGAFSFLMIIYHCMWELWKKYISANILRIINVYKNSYKMIFIRII